MSRPVVIVTSPVDAALDVAVSVAPYAVFDQALNPASVNFQTVQLLNSSNVPLTGVVAYDSVLRKVTFTPSAVLSYSSVYTFRLVGWRKGIDAFEHGIMNLYSEALYGIIDISFTTIAPPTPDDPEAPATPENTQDVVGVDPANAEIMVPVELDNHYMALEFLLPVPLTQVITTITGNDDDALEDLILVGVTTRNSAAGVLNWVLQSVDNAGVLTYDVELLNGAIVVAHGTGVAGSISLDEVSGSGIHGSVTVGGDDAATGTITVNLTIVPLYDHLSITGVNCIGLYGANYPEINFSFEWEGLIYTITEASVANTYIGRVSYSDTDLTNSTVYIEVGHYVIDDLGAVIWEQLDLPFSYQFVITVEAGVGSTSLLTNGLPTDHIYYFVTELEPMWATITIIRLNIGPYIRGVPDDTIARLIYELSWLARRLYYDQYGVWLPIDDIDRVPAAIIQYIICKAKLDALDAAFADYTGSGSAVSKTLGDFKVDRGSVGGNPLASLRKKYEQCILDSSHAAGIDFRQLVVRATIIAEFDPRRPITDYSWRRWPEVPTTMNQNGLYPETKSYIARNLETKTPYPNGV